MRYYSSESIEFFIKNSESKTTNEWIEYFGCERGSISRWAKKYSVKVKKAEPIRFISEETKKKISKGRKEWLSQNPDKHPWRNSNKFKSKPCENVKRFLKKKSVNFVEEFSPEIQGRFFSIDIALPDKMIAIEINGNQHYEKTGELKPYYQSRHDLLEAGGWTVFQVHYSACFNLEKWGEFLNQIESLPSTREFDYFNYKPKKKTKENWQNNCECGNLKSSKAKKCITCIKKINQERVPSKDQLQNLYDSLPMTEIAKLFNVSDTAVKKWLGKMNILTENRRGFWAKKKSNLGTDGET